MLRYRKSLESVNSKVFLSHTVALVVMMSQLRLGQLEEVLE